MERMLFVTLQSRYMKSDTEYKRKAPHVASVLVKIQDFVLFPCIFSSAYLARKAEICYIMHAEVFMPGAKKMPERDETK